MDMGMTRATGTGSQAHEDGQHSSMLYLLHITSHHIILFYSTHLISYVVPQAQNPGEGHSTGMRWNRRTGQWYRTKSWGKGVQMNQNHNR